MDVVVDGAKGLIGSRVRTKQGRVLLGWLFDVGLDLPTKQRGCLTARDGCLEGLCLAQISQEVQFGEALTHTFRTLAQEHPIRCMSLLWQATDTPRCD